MTSTHPTRRLAHWLAPAVGLLLLFAAYIGGTHHHDDGFVHECAVCTVGHAPAVAADFVASAAGPDGPDGTCLVNTAGGPRAARAAAPSCRAPPRS